MLLGANVSAVGRLIMRSARMAMMRSRCLLTTLVHRKHRTTMGGSGNLGRLDVDLYLLTGTLILIVVDGVTDVGGEFALGILSGLRPRPTEGPSIPESCACIPRSGAHIREVCDGWVGLAGRGTRALFRVCQCIFRASPFHYNKLIRGKYFERFQVNVPVTLQYLGLGSKTRVSYLCSKSGRHRSTQETLYSELEYPLAVNPRGRPPGSLWIHGQQRGCKVMLIQQNYPATHVTKVCNVLPRRLRRSRDHDACPGTRAEPTRRWGVVRAAVRAVRREYRRKAIKPRRFLFSKRASANL